MVNVDEVNLDEAVTPHLAQLGEPDIRHTEQDYVVVDSPALLGFPNSQIAHFRLIRSIHSAVKALDKLAKLTVAIFNIGYVIGERER